MSPIGGDISRHDHEFDFVEWMPVDRASETLTYTNEVRMFRRGFPWSRKMPQPLEAVSVRGEKVVLREKRVEDASRDYSWRVDTELAKLDATRPLNMSYSSFLEYSKEELRYPNPLSRRLAIDTLDGEHIGNCMYYDIDLKRGEAEPGHHDRPSVLGQGYGTDSVDALLGHIFTTTSLDRVYLHTLEWNNRARRSFAKSASGRSRRSGGAERTSYLWRYSAASGRGLRVRGPVRRRRAHRTERRFSDVTTTQRLAVGPCSVTSGQPQEPAPTEPGCPCPVGNLAVVLEKY